MSNASKTKYIATCPITGETATRTSAHAYTHALTVRVVGLYKRDDSRPCIMVKSKGQRVPEGYIRTIQPGSSMYGQDTPALAKLPGEQVAEVRSLVSFHHSEELAVKAARAMTLGGWCAVEAFPVPCRPL